MKAKLYYTDEELKAHEEKRQERLQEVERLKESGEWLTLTKDQQAGYLRGLQKVTPLQFDAIEPDRGICMKVLEK